MSKQAMSRFKLVSMEPAAEMVEAAQDAYMPFGDMDLAIRMALLAAPDVQGEPVAYRVTGSYTDLPFKDESSAKAYCRGLLSGDPEGGYRINPLYATPPPAEQKPAPDVAGPTKVRYIDGLGAVRNSPADCREGVSYVTVADTVYWPLRADDAQRLLSAEFGRGDFTGPGTSTDVSALVKALERIASMDSMSYHSLDSAKITARAALSGYRKKQETSRDYQ